KILGLTCDNASANDMMTNKLEYRMLEFEGQISQIQCMLHVGNLVAKMMIRQFNLPRNQEMGELGTE
ncbi:hypothetical protein EDD16DRAFT_1431141, partial [Pisolithus croceorrhizus]